jgi:DNA polymerase III epsilon subunit-like protein
VILLGFDTETTGLDKQKDRITEVGLVLYSTAQNRILESVGFLVKDDVPIPEEVTKKTGITQAALDRFGYDPGWAIEEFNRLGERADAILGHNVLRFDKPILENASARLGTPLIQKPWVDTMLDIPGVKGEKLITMCAEMGFVFRAHGAVSDATSTIELVYRHAKDSPEKDFSKILERAKSPLVCIRSHQDRGNEANKTARKLGFRWNGEMKIWWQVVKEVDLDAITKAAPFSISQLDKTITPDMLWD